MKKIALFTLIVLGSYGCFACDCKESRNDSIGIVEAYEQSDVVTVARVSEIILHEDTNKISNYRTVKMIIQRAYKGVQKRDTITVTAYIGGPSCGVELNEGVVYLLYAYNHSKLGITTDSCTRTTIFTSTVYDTVILDNF